MWYWAYVGGFFLVAIIGITTQCLMRRSARRKKAALRIVYNSDGDDNAVVIRQQYNGLYDVNTIE